MLNVQIHGSRRGWYSLKKYYVLCLWEVIVQHVEKMVLQMQFSGYTQNFHYKVVIIAAKAYNDIKHRVQCGKCLPFRPYEWNHKDRDTMKKKKAVVWYR